MSGELLGWTGSEDTGLTSTVNFLMRSMTWRRGGQSRLALRSTAMRLLGVTAIRYAEPLGIATYVGKSHRCQYAEPQRTFLLSHSCGLL